MKYSWQQLSQTFEGFLSDHIEVEQDVGSAEELTRGIDPRALYTSLDDLKRIQTHPLVRGRWVDLGAGPGHSIMAYHQLHPDRGAIGVEKSPARVRAGHRLLTSLGLSKSLLLEEDLMNTSLPDGDTFFLYFPTGMILDHILHQLSKMESFRLVAIESHGDLLPRLRLEPGLRVIGEVPLLSPRHHPFALIFEKGESIFSKQELFNRSFKEDFLLIREGEKMWVAETIGAEWIGGESFNLRYPPRTIEHAHVDSFLKARDLCSLTKFLCELRRRGELEITTGKGELRGEIRKIFVRPSFCLELSAGQTVKWDDVQAITLKGHRCYDSSSRSPFSLPVA